ncbi:MAG: hypothetical protein ABDH28_00820 [Brevinematia bacterium]
MKKIVTLFVAVVTFLDPAYCFEVWINSQELSHFDYIQVTLKGWKGDSSELRLVLLKDGGTSVDLLGRDTVTPRLVGEDLVFLYIPNYGVRDGIYEILILSNDVEIFRTNVVFVSRQQLKLCEPLKILTFEENVSILKLVTNRGRVSYKEVANLISSLMKKIGLNTFVILGGQTTFLKNPREVWYSGVLSNLKVLKHLKEEGIQTGAYVMCFLTLGQTKKNSFKGYLPNLVFRGKKIEEDYKYTSILSHRRVEDIVEILTYLGRRNDIDFLGLDFIRVGDYGGYEMFFDFYEEIYSKLSTNSVPFIARPKGRRKEVEEFAKLVSRREDVRKIFRWYQAVRVSRVIKAIRDKLRERGITKPIVAFMLGWNAGREHGQDLFMFRDAGVDYAFYMLYEFYNDRMFEEAGNYYLRYVYNLDTNIVFGNIIDSVLNRGSKGPLKTFSERLKKFVTYYSYFPPNGFFFHDIYRLYFGRLGSFKTEDWIKEIEEAVMFIDETTFSENRSFPEKTTLGSSE